MAVAAIVSVVAVRAVGSSVLGGLQRSVTRFDGADNTFADHVRRQPIKRALERIAREDILAVDPRLAILPVDVLPEQHLVELVYVRIGREHDVAGVVEGEAVDLEGAAPPADTLVLFQ